LLCFGGGLCFGVGVVVAWAWCVDASKGEALGLLCGVSLPLLAVSLLCGVSVGVGFPLGVVGLVVVWWCRLITR